MRISNGMRCVEDATIKVAQWSLRKGIVTAAMLVLVPASIVAGAVVGAADTSVLTTRMAIKVVKEV